MLANLSSRIIAFIVIGVSLLAALTWYLTAYQSAQTTIAEITTEIQDLEAKKQVGVNAQQNVIRLCRVVAGLEADKTNFLSSLPSSEQFSKLLTSIRNQIATNKGQLNSITRQLGGGSSTVAIPAGIRAVNMTLALEGTYGSLFGILVSLEQQQRFLSVDNLSFTQATQNNQNGLVDPALITNPKLSSSLNIAAYVYDDPNRNTQTSVNPICTNLPASEPQTPATPPTTGEVPK
jgi:Type II secretion system (T2SS), protein M subtype b